jgi:hypothetical protein
LGYDARVSALALTALVAAFALFVTAHVGIVMKLLFRHPRWRAALALVIPPLAPYWGASERMTGWSLVWVGSLVAYVIALIATTLTG